jgi:hypothetical protein
LNLWRGNSPGGSQRAPRRRLGQAGAIVIALAYLAWFGTPVKGRQAPGAPPNQVETDPIKCWWKTDTNAVHVGEPFTLALTCGVIETDAVRVVVDPARLDPAVVETTPFEVLGGIRHGDMSAPPWRYFQYSYTLRLLGEEFFGRDVDIPALPLTYRVQPASGDAGQARDQLYLLPALPLRVLSLVPVTATDIRDAPRDTFADIESRSWRATREFAAAGVFFALAALLAGVAAVRAFGRSHAREPGAAALLPGAAVFGACEREAQRVKTDTAGGWTPELVGRALAAFRVAGAVALGRPVAQTRVEARERPREGQLLVEMGPWRAHRLLISASTTGAVITGRLAADREMDPPLREALEDLAVGLDVFGGSHYSRSGELDGGRLDEALDRGLRGLDRLRSSRRWPGRVAEAVGRTVAAFRQATWAR